MRQFDNLRNDLNKKPAKVNSELTHVPFTVVPVPSTLPSLTHLTLVPAMDARQQWRIGRLRQPAEEKRNQHDLKSHGSSQKTGRDQFSFSRLRMVVLENSSNLA